MRISARNRSKLLGGQGDTSKWRNSLVDIPCFLIGNGPLSLQKDTKLQSLLDGRFTIGINRAFKIIDPTILMWQDLALWIQHKKELKKKLKALKYCRKDAATGQYCYHFFMTETKSKLPIDPSSLHGRGSSGPLSFQLAYALGCNPIVLVGMDCKYSKDGKTDFYGKNPMHRPFTLKSCKKGLKWIRDVRHGRTIINCSKNSVFKEKFSIEEALEKIKDIKKYSREELYSKILNNKNYN